jgi:hypothetical protein
MKRLFTLAVITCLAFVSTAYAQGGRGGGGARSGAGVGRPATGAGIRADGSGLGLGSGSTLGTTVAPGTVATGGGRDIPSPDALTRVPN